MKKMKEMFATKWQVNSAQWRSLGCGCGHVWVCGFEVRFFLAIYLINKWWR